MKTFILIISSLWILLDSAMHCHAPSPSQQIQPKTTTYKPITPIAITNITDKILVSNYLNTFNTEGFYFHQEPENEDLYVFYLQELSAKALRYPGGTLSNFYHHTLPGYGIRQEDVDQTKGDFIGKAAQKHFNKQTKVLQKHPTSQNYLNSFIPMSLASGTSVIITLNMFSSDVPELKQYLEKLKKDQVRVSHIELGNEYFFKAYEAVFPDVTTYIQKSKQVASMARGVFPEVLIGVSIADVLTIDNKSITPHFQRLKKWNEALSKESFYDAIVVHNYSKTKSCTDEASNINLDCVFQENTEHIYLEFPSSMAYYQNNFTGKQIWITEWNTSRLFEVTCNTFLQALYYTEYMFQLMHYPEITLASYHNLLAGDCGYNLIKQNKNEISTSITYEAAKLLAPLFKDSTYLVIDRGKKNETTTGDLIVRQFETKNVRYIYIINSSNKAQGVSIKNFLSGSPESIKEVIALLASDLSSSMGTNNFPNGSQAQVKKIAISDDLQVSPWSITRVTLDK